jgi:hypothetical protein
LLLAALIKNPAKDPPIEKQQDQSSSTDGCAFSVLGYHSARSEESAVPPGYQPRHMAGSRIKAGFSR